MDRRIRRVLRWLDAEVNSAMVAEYRRAAREQHGSVRAAVEADEAAMRAESGVA
jgi:hypothetical protein